MQIMAALLASYVFCTPGYSASVRPPYAYTHAIKLELLHGRSPACCELDHRIPLELGGNPYARSNLWLEPWPDARIKDREENRLHWEVCSGHMSLSAAVREMQDWKD